MKNAKHKLSFTISQYNVKHNLHFRKFGFSILLILTVLLNGGCARKTPTENIIDNHIEHINEVLDYSYNNIEQDKDTIFLQNELKNCKMVLEDTKQTYHSEISTCNAKINYWRLMTFCLGLFLSAWIFLRIRHIF